MKIKIIELLFVLFGFAYSSWGQQEVPAKKDPLPPGPLIAPDAGAFAQWVITVTQPPKPKAKDKTASPGAEPGGSPSQETLQQIVITKTKPVVRVQTVAAGNVVEDRWIVGDAQVVTASGLKSPYLIAGAHSEGMLYPNKDFAELSWVKESNYVGIKKVSGRESLIFNDVLTIDYDGSSEQVSAVAQIDLETRLPVAFQFGQQVRTYQFRSPPKSVQQIPSAVQDVMKIANQNNAIMNRPAGRP